MTYPKCYLIPVYYLQMTPKFIVTLETRLIYINCKKILISYQDSLKGSRCPLTFPSVKIYTLIELTPTMFTVWLAVVLNKLLKKETWEYLIDNQVKVS